MALAMIEAAEADGRLRPGGSVVEYTGGSTGVSLAFVCAAKRHPAADRDVGRVQQGEAGPHDGAGRPPHARRQPDRRDDEGAHLEMIETARRLAAAPGRVLDGSAEQPGDQLSGLRRGWARRSGSRPAGGSSAFVQSVGTAGSVRGISDASAASTTTACASSRWSPRSRPCCRAARRAGRTRSTAWARGSSCRCGPTRSPTRSRRSRRRTRWRPPGGWPGEEGIFAGTSTGANVAVALRVAGAPGARPYGGHRGGRFRDEVPEHGAVRPRMRAGRMRRRRAPFRPHPGLQAGRGISQRYRAHQEAGRLYRG